MENWIRNNLWKKVGVLNIILFPFMALYILIFHILRKKTHIELDAFCICVGNITVGGNGKTPFVIALAKKLMNTGLNVAVISKGYGSKAYKNNSIIKVDTHLHTSAEVGDEPLLIANTVPTFVSSNRVKSAKEAIKLGYNVLIFDDGMQDFSFKKDYIFALINSEYGFGNKLILPAGPLRSSLALAYYDSNCIVITGQTPKTLQSHDIIYDLFAKSHAKITNGQDESYVAFCGIANPDSFFNTLNNLECNVVETTIFNDHHNFTNAELNSLINKAKELDASLICTQKDWVRIPKNLQHHFQYLEYELVFKIPEGLMNRLI